MRKYRSPKAKEQNDAETLEGRNVLFKIVATEVDENGSFCWDIECERDVSSHEVIGILEVVKLNLANEE